MGNPIFAPSLMCMDIANLTGSLTVMNAHCHMYHVDVMDGHFVKNLSLSAEFVRAIRGHAALPIEAHLMVTNPENYLKDFVDAGANMITFHAETVTANAFTVIREIQSMGVKAGVCLCPATPALAAESYLDAVDMVTVMTVDPGDKGRPFIPQMIEKVEKLDAIRKERGYKYLIQCDGAIGPGNYRELYRAGARAFVMGSSGLFRKEGSLEENCLKMKKEFFQITGIELTMREKAERI